MPTTTTTPSLVDVLLEDADAIADEAVDALRREVPVVLTAASPDELRATIAWGIRRFAEVWESGNGSGSPELRRLIAPTLTLHGAIEREDALHALRVIVEVCRHHEARRFAEASPDPAHAVAILRQTEAARRLSASLITELDTTLHRVDAGSGRRRARLDTDLLALLLSHPTAPETAVSLAREHGLDLAGAWTLAVCDAPAHGDDPALGPRGAAATGTEDVLLGRRGSYLVVAAREDPAAFLGGAPAGIQRAADPAGFRDAFDDALAALRVAIVRGGPVSFEDALLDLVLLGARPASELATRLLAALADPDPDRTDWLLATLAAYLDASASVTAAARLLNLHRESFRYRLQQLEERLGDKLRDPDGRLELHIAVRAARLSGD